MYKETGKAPKAFPVFEIQEAGMGASPIPVLRGGM